MWGTMTLSKSFKLLASQTLGAACLCALVAPAVFAYDPTARFSLTGQLGATSLAMGTVNDEIDRGNVYMRSQRWDTLDNLGSGFNFIYDVRADLFGPWMLSFGGGSTIASTGVDFDEVIDIKPSASFLQARIFYRIPWRPFENVRFCVGGGGVMATSAELEITHEHRTVEAGILRRESLTFDGTGAGVVAAFEAELVLNERFTLAGDLGYRGLKVDIDSDSYEWSITNVDDPAVDRDGDDVPEGRDLSDRSFLRNAFIDPIQANDQEDVELFRTVPMELDYSGVQAHVGLRVYLF